MLRGIHAGQRATLLERRKDEEKVVVQLVDELEVCVILADDVAAATSVDEY